MIVRIGIHIRHIMSFSLYSLLFSELESEVEKYKEEKEKLASLESDIDEKRQSLMNGKDGLAKEAKSVRENTAKEKQHLMATSIQQRKSATGKKHLGYKG